jgi:hypothetical protein
MVASESTNMPTSTTIKSIMDGKRQDFADCNFGASTAEIVASIASYYTISIKLGMVAGYVLIAIDTTHLVMVRKVVVAGSIVVATVEGTAVGACFVVA